VHRLCPAFVMVDSSNNVFYRGPLCCFIIRGATQPVSHDVIVIYFFSIILVILLYFLNVCSGCSFNVSLLPEQKCNSALSRCSNSLCVVSIP